MSSKIFFVVGNSRSGTTMMGRILGKHSDVFTFHELHFFEQLWSPDEINQSIDFESSIELFSKLLCIEREGYLSGCSENKKYFSEVKFVLEQTNKKQFLKSDIFELFLNNEVRIHGKNIACDQTPRNLFYVEEILLLYPDAKIIYMIRDPRDVMLSQKNKWKRRFMGAKNIPLKEAFRAWVNYHPITISKLWNASVNSMKKFSDSPSVQTILFEELLNDPISTMQGLCIFLNIEYKEEMLNVPQIGSSAGYDNPLELGINKSRTKGYSQGGLTKTELYLCEKITNKNMLFYGYKLDKFKPNIFELLIMLLSFPLKIITALMLNIKRMKNIVETIKRRMK